MACGGGSEFPALPKNWDRGEFIDRGAHGDVYLVVDRDPPKKENFVVKEFRLTERNEKKKKKIMHSFKTETDVLQRLKHPRILPLIDTLEEKDTLSIVLPYMKQGSLLNYVKDKGGLSEAQARFFTRQLLDGVSYLHDNRTLHRDIKCANLLMDDEHNLCIADFGISKVLETITGTKTELVGTGNWMAPEVMKGEGYIYNYSVDIWSIACTLVEMITTQPPFPEKKWNEFYISHYSQDKGPEYKLPEDSSPSLIDFLNKCFQMDPEKRPTAKELMKHEFLEERLREREDKESCLTRQDLLDFKLWVVGELQDLKQKQSEKESSQSWQQCIRDELKNVKEATEDLSKVVETTMQEQNAKSTSSFNDLKNSILKVEGQLKIHMAEQIQSSENFLETRLVDSLCGTENRIIRNTNFVIGTLEENLTQTTHEVKEQLKTHMTRFQDTEKSLETKQTQSQENVKKEILGSINTVIAKLGNNQEVEKELKTHIIQKVLETEKSLQTKLAQSQENIKKEISGSTNTVIAQLENNQEVEKELKTHIIQRVLETEKSLEAKLTQNQENFGKDISGSTNSIIAQLQSNRVVVKELKTHTTQQVQNSAKSLKEELEKVKTETIQQIKQSSNESTQTTKSEIETKLKTNTETVKDFMTDVKKELFKFTEKECSITRLKIADPTIEVRSSTFDFYVKDFKDLVKSGKDVYSVPWYIDEFQSCVEGEVWFHTNGEMEVWLQFGRNHLEMGLQPRQVDLKIKVTITDRTGNLPELLVGEGIWNANEENVKDNRDWGRHIGTLKCDDVITKKYNQCNYSYGAVLLRYHIDVV